MHLKALLIASVAAALVTAATPYSHGANPISFKTIEDKVINHADRCSSCHGEHKEQPPLNYQTLRGYLEDSSEDEILKDGWFPITYCNGTLKDEQRRLILDWYRQGFPR